MNHQAPNPFDKLPIETNQHIASYIEYDSDVCAFSRACRSTHYAVDGDKYSFWRRRFLGFFEKPKWTSGSNLRYKNEFRKRRTVLKHGTLRGKQGKDFVTGNTAKERMALEVLRDLIVDSFSEKGEDNNGNACESMNLNHVRRFINAHDLLRIVFDPQRQSRSRGHHSKDRGGPTNPLMTTLQVLLAPELLSFNGSLNSYHFSFPVSQAVVYATAEQQPMLGGCNGLDVNMDWILHHINFWRYHMVREAECTLFNAFYHLEKDERPSFWSERLKQGGRKLGKHWKGSYAYVDRPIIQDIRAGHGQDRNQFLDEFNGELEVSAFQDMRLDFVDEDHMPWYDVFEQYLHSKAAPVSRAKTRAQHRSATPEGLESFKPLRFRFEGEGHDHYEDFLAAGCLNALPQQHGVPGWQRMTMMKYFVDPDTEEIDKEALWAYEGIVLPGGKIMLGRWWSPNDGTGNDMYSGPFILWAVNGPKDEEYEPEVGEDMEGDGP